MIIATNVLGMETIGATMKSQMSLYGRVKIAHIMRAIERMISKEMVYKKKVAVSEWIPVNKRLPEECKEVLVTVKDDSADSPVYYTAVGWYYAGIWVVEDAVCHQVVAWMKPPKPYKERRCGK